MYTGIVQGAVEVTRVDDRPGLKSFSVALPADLLADLEIGASVAVDGVCLTVTAIDGRDVAFDAIQETQERTTLGRVESGSRVNVERSAKAGAEIGGHELSGHIDGTVRIVEIERDDNNCILTFKAPSEYMKYVFSKGFIALNGCSLTVVDVDRHASTFTVHLIPETLRATTFGEKQTGDDANFEIERKTQVIVDTVRDFLRQHAEDGTLGGLASVSASCV